MKLLCPRCKAPMEDVEIDGSSYDLCPSCKGIWFDNDELIYFLKPRVGQSHLDLIEKNAKPGTLSCPRCGEILKEMKFTVGSDSCVASGTDLLIDRCPSCKGVWLDKDELVKAQEVAEGLPEAEKRVPHPQMYSENPFPPAPPDRSGFSPYSFVIGVCLFLLTAFTISSLGRKKAASLPQASQSACPTCHGAGKRVILCETCKGSGHTGGFRTASCPQCNGRGTLSSGASSCQKCRGTGWIQGEEKSCERCRGSGRVEEVRKETCGTCNGSGQMMVRQICTVCGGSGKSSVNPQWGCANCSGSGYVTSKKTCSSCMGGVVERRVSSVCPECSGRGRSASEKRVCDQCMGTGSLDGSTSNVCGRCSGTGTVQIPSGDNQMCATCQGKGNVGQVVCETCKGKGEI